MKKIAVFASGSGSNFQAIVDAIKEKKLNAEVSLLVCDKPGARVIERAEEAGVEYFTFFPKQYETKAEFETEILKRLRAKGIEFIVLAGYMRLIGGTLLADFEGRIVNIHPSLLPDFPGKDAIGQALEAQAGVSGVTVHYVDSGMDTGPVIAQKAVMIRKEDTRESLQQRIQQVEHELFPRVLEELFNQEKVGGVQS
ncbi:phosphoribosylglycinamide formyltransferase [Fictibacillus terranigra]|uniref:Phosphoribosylglycinamide formyltransferase n=1 Tax=Fictibacillus terranigra TaxID=3058424 RepID=A0ABT8EAB4_9BACL|nr:phosphoribosylglycinamide formyltransferase [Fictibacillus sp. CENA-BCM004]MDN4074863.1 phosphoribosylglycinamide formyltransferase [Fictibacillus sp. CENA-BCM004]